MRTPNLLTTAIFAIMIGGLLSIIAVATQDQNKELPPQAQEQLEYYRNKHIKMGVYDMHPEIQAKSKLHVTYKWDTMEFYP